MKNLLVVGDSFCHYRSQPQDWPVHLSSLLGRNLIGFGLPGVAWWWTKSYLNKIAKSKAFAAADIVVMCHTDPYRMIGSRRQVNFGNPDIPSKVSEVYHKYIANEPFLEWAYQHWFQEVNMLMSDKKTLHIQNFPSSRFCFADLQGLRLNWPTLFEHSMQDLGTDVIDGFLYDQRRNHFSVQGNLALAEFLHDMIQQHWHHWPSADFRLDLYPPG